ncbi:hypothetical protein WKI68_10285 [Streptomyces sp. MS1.HAVA.3]|uniref:Uncharacterized protein n=1 Tax=Streptomyces caledonius TaxID=3134107 RepID=A0ABU8U1J8_9ACTN
MVVRTSLQRKVGGYDPELPHAGDIEMWMRLAAHADVGYVRGADQAFYRVHGNNMSTTDFGGQLDDLRQRLVAFDSVLDKCADLLPGAGRLSVAARTRLARYALRRAYRAYDRGRTALVPVDELVEFAAECLPEGYTSLAEYRALRRRRRVGRVSCRTSSRWCSRPSSTGGGSGCGGGPGSAEGSDAPSVHPRLRSAGRPDEGRRFGLLGRAPGPAPASASVRRLRLRRVRSWSDHSAAATPATTASSATPARPRLLVPVCATAVGGTRRVTLIRACSGMACCVCMSVRCLV